MDSIIESMLLFYKSLLVISLTIILSLDTYSIIITNIYFSSNLSITPILNMLLFA